MQGQNISDIIERYLKEILANSEEIEIRRSEIADQFDVVPSQINYVIKTRFTIQNGYVVESKRGGGGYIRIEKVKLLDDIDVLDSLIRVIGDSLDERDAISILGSLYEDSVLSKREASLLASTLSKSTLNIGDRNLEEQIRAKVMIGILNHLRYE
ncbi:MULTISPECIES: CtsR family transcriptional regulator [Pediococcus]|uniref:Transcriptional regulator CtsR n=1 Tax=Pediococcus pentosaceus (strain ATCC 25745 / CCUG 21536 / LMG 10740 / 183-1w) TaxID=278197 RepID=Q03EA7_PEDPA|nr:MULTISPECIES: CtsR family transcriptional regulator [Pediococcus]ABJ68465.1 Transcriptional repressor of class III stress genes [Pediococcus pentosaceus ATCC 25745]KAF5439489.1 CtsR family transcriptional regulator [Pediococcus sp. EKM202D]KAF5439783.1 CtsR family transcriptional regulator [Pediococcus sp. EKM201D]QHM65739.1 Transcriptional regulator CtsR [Pediococcus pentosaceus]QHM67458.1 Transcriptional regulator CtsR [Pediococcus pentosaceus]